MTNNSLAKDYFRKVLIRRKALEVLQQEGGFSDVVRESQELVELLLKALLRLRGIEPPKWHDVGPILKQNKELFVIFSPEGLDRAVEFSKYLRKERELALYGDEDYLPTESYSMKDGLYCLTEVDWLIGKIKGEFA